MTVNQNTSTSSTLDVYRQLNVKYSELNAIDSAEQAQAISRYKKEDSITVGIENYDKNDYEKVLEKYKNRESDVISHELGHSSNPNAKNVNYTYEMGPDGNMYVSGGSTTLDTSIPTESLSAMNKLDSLISAASNTDMSSADAVIAREANLNKMVLMNSQKIEE